MEYCKNYCVEKGISASKLNEAQRILYYIAENMMLTNSISEEGYRDFQMAIKALEQESIIDKIRAEIENQEKWLMSAGYNAYNVDIAFSSIKSVLAESEEY